MRRIKHAKTALAIPSIAYTDWNDYLVDEAGAVIDLDTLAGESLLAPTFVLLGDSITVQDTNQATSPPSPCSSGYFTWAGIILRGLKSLKNAGGSGERTDQMLARLATDVITYSPDWCIVQGGGNDVTQGKTAAQIEASLTSIYAQLLAAGIRVVACTITPTINADTASEKAVLYAVNAWIRSYARANRGIVLCDWFNAIADATTGNPATGMTSDGVHPSPIGALRMGRVLATALDPFITTIDDLLPFSNAQVGNLLANPMLAGDGGGGLATSWLTNANGWTLATSKVPKVWPALGEWQQIASSSPPVTHNAFNLYQSNANAGVDWSVGDQIYGVFEFELDAGWTQSWGDQTAPIAAVVRAHNVIETSMPQQGSSPAVLYDGLPTSGLMRTAVLTIPAGTTSVRLFCRCSLTATVRFGRCGLLKV